jgi:hypothetical protein
MKSYQVITLGVLCAPVTQSFGEEITIRDVRPVAAAAEKFEEQFQLPVTYEDPRYLFAGDVEDITTKISTPEALVFRAARGEALPVLKGMKERELRFPFTPAVTPDGQQAAIQRALDANNSERPPAIFEVRQAGGRFHVYPTRVKNSAGEYVGYKSLLEVRITMEPKDRSCSEFLHEFYISVNLATNSSIGGGATEPQSTCRTPTGGKNVLARELLLDFVSDQERQQAAWGIWSRWSWQLLSNPTEPNVFALNLYAIPEATGQPQPNTTSNTRPVNPNSQAGVRAKQGKPQLQPSESGVMRSPWDSRFE